MLPRRGGGKVGHSEGRCDVMLFMGDFVLGAPCYCEPLDGECPEGMMMGMFFEWGP